MFCLMTDPTPGVFPDDGRSLTDDGFDSFMRVLTNGRVTGDNVRPHGDLLLEFPYVGPPHLSLNLPRAPAADTAIRTTALMAIDKLPAAARTA